MVKKVRKRRIKIIPFLILIVLLCCLYVFFRWYLKLPTHNIYIYHNQILKDQEIIDLAGLTNYPSFYKVNRKTITKKLLNHELIKDVKVERRFFHTFKIKVTEYDIILYDYVSHKFISSNGNKLNGNYDITGVPILLNYVPNDVYEKFITKLTQVDSSIVTQISEIKYEPSEYDNGRFFLTMSDGNYIYVNLANFSSLNHYNDIYPSFENHIGILYLDSGYGEASEYKILK